MANLLYVNSNLVTKLKEHSAYYFWFPIIRNFPLRVVPLEERSFHPRNIEIEDGYIYLTVDMKFIYCRDGMASFLYADQDLSFRFTTNYGILRTLDNKQFTAIIGKVAQVISSSDIELVEVGKVYHPLIDFNLLSVDKENLQIDKTSIEEINLSDESINMEQKPKRKRGRPRKTDAKPNIPQKPKREYTKRNGAGDGDDGDLDADDIAKEILKNHSRQLCDEVYNLRVNEKCTYISIANRYKIEKKQAKQICVYYEEIQKNS